jgi:hypothetical protein
MVPDSGGQSTTTVSPWPGWWQGPFSPVRTQSPSSERTYVLCVPEAVLMALARTLTRDAVMISSPSISSSKPWMSTSQNAPAELCPGWPPTVPHSTRADVELRSNSVLLG